MCRVTSQQGKVIQNVNLCILQFLLRVIEANLESNHKVLIFSWKLILHCEVQLFPCL